MITSAPGGDTSPWVAFLDESGSDSRRDPGAYIVSAVVLDAADVEEVREAMTVLRLPGQRKLHWRDEDDDRRLTIVKTLSQLPIEHYVAVHDGHAAEPSERRRRLAMERLLFELDQMGATEVIMESRGPKDDRRDRNHLDQLRAAQTVGSAVRMNHAKGPVEPGLWTADATCGAIVRDRVGDPTYRAVLEARLTVYQTR